MSAGLRWSLRERLLNVATAGVESVFGVSFRHGAFDSEFARAWMRGVEMLLGTSKLDKPYAQHPVVHQAIRTVAEDAASIPWEAYPAKTTGRKKASPLDAHPILDWFAKPADGMTRRALIEATVIQYLLDGELGWYYPDVVIQPANMPEAARLQSGGLVVVRKDETRWSKEPGRPIVARFVADGSLVDLKAYSIFKAYNPYGFRGLGVMDTLMTDARADFGAAKWNEHMLADRNGIPNLVLKPPATSGGTPKQRREVKERWESTFPSSRSGVGVVPAGWDLMELGGTRKDMEYGGLRSGAREMILGGVGLVPFLAGVLDNANYANSREQKFVYWRGTIARVLSRLEDVINEDMLPKLGVTDVRLYPRWEAVRAMADDVEQKSRIGKAWFDLGLSKKVINEELEMGWDEADVEDYDVAYLPANYIPVDQIGDVSGVGVGVPPADAPPSDAPPVDTPPAEETPPAKPKSRAKLTAAQIADRRLTIWRLSILRLRVLEKPFEAMMRSWFHGVETRVVDRVRSLAGMRLASIGRDLRAMHGAGPWPDDVLRATDGPIDSVLFDLNDATRELVSRATPRIKAALISGGETVIVDAGLDVNFNPNDMRLAAKLVEQQLKVRKIPATVRDQLRETLQEGINKGESADQLAARVTETMGAAKTRAATIARTEMGTAYSNGRMIGMRQAGITEHEWLSARDDLVRPSHAKVDGDRALVGEPFDNGLLYPLDPAGPPEEVINCRCTTLPVVTEE